MNNRRVVVIAALLAVVVGVIVVMTLRSFAPQQAPSRAAASATASAPVVADTAPTADDATPSSSEPPPPWAQQADATAQPAANPGAAVDPARQQQLQQLQSAVQGITADAIARAGESSKNMYKALDALQAMNDPTVTSQINLKALRHNLDTSVQMQAAAKNLLQLMQQPESAENTQKMDALMAEIRQLQAQMVPDVRTKGSKLPPITAPTVTH